MMKKFYTMCTTLLMLGGGVVAQVVTPDVEIVPWPNEITVGGGSLTLTEGVSIKGGKGFTADYLADMLIDDYGIEQGGGVKITLNTDKKLSESLGAEGYRLNVDAKGIRITAVDKTGLFYGVETLRQLIAKNKIVPYVSIEDRPAFSWRSYMLDESRYFQGKAVVTKMLDEMARLKMNVLHWHLTDHNGWRIEIKKYPLLTEVGSKRDSTEIITWNSGKADGKPHGGFYTQEQIREIVAYAAERHITIIPEIDMPGHAASAIAAYPWLGSTKEQIKVPYRFSDGMQVFNVADPKVYEFLQDVITEIADLFPSQVIHIGGDEVKHDHWKQSPDVKALMEREGMKNLNDVQIYFTNNMSNFIESIDRRMMGWNEIMGKNIHEWSEEDDATLSSTLSKNAIIHFWKGDVALIKEALAKGHDVVNSTHNFTYLDYNYKSISVKKAYEFNPIPEGIPAEDAARVLGLGCQMWTEWTPTTNHVYRQTFPRIAAYAETGWTEEQNKDYARFERDLPRLKEEWKSRGIIAGGEAK